MKRGLTSSLREDHTQYISKGRQGNKDRKSFLGLLSENITEERGSKNATRANDLFFWHGSKVCNLPGCQQVFQELATRHRLTFARMYRMDTIIKAVGAAILRVLMGLLVSLRA
jgi:hypothetical protein